MIKKILLIAILAAIQIQASAILERKIDTKSKFTKQVVKCRGGNKSFILIKDDIFYSDKYEKFLFAQDAAEDSCRNKRLRSKKGAIVCVRKKDMYRFLLNGIKKNKKAKVPGSCLTLKRSIPLKIKNHFPFTSQITYYEIEYKGKKLYISSQSLSNPRKYKSTTYKRRHEKKRVKRKVYKKKKVRKRKQKNYRKKQATHKVAKRYDTNIYGDSANNQISNNTNDVQTMQNENITNSIQKPYIEKKEQYYTYRCVGIYGDNRITVDNDSSMTAASNSVWRRCQALKKDNEVCKITDCYKLIK